MLNLGQNGEVRMPIRNNPKIPTEPTNIQVLPSDDDAEEDEERKDEKEDNDEEQIIDFGAEEKADVFPNATDMKRPEAYYETKQEENLKVAGTEVGTRLSTRNRTKTEKQKEIDAAKNKTVDINSYSISKLNKTGLIGWIKNKRGVNEKGEEYTYENLLEMSEPKLRAISKSIKDTYYITKKGNKTRKAKDDDVPFPEY